MCCFVYIFTLKCQLIFYAYNKSKFITNMCILIFGLLTSDNSFQLIELSLCHSDLTVSDSLSRLVNIWGSLLKLL